MNSLPTRTEIPAELAKVSLYPHLGALAFDWGVIAGAIVMAERFPLTFILAQVLIATRQHALFLIMHEGTHFLILKNRKWNDILSNFLAAWPVGVSTEKYRVRHWHHHRYLNSEKDPDWFRKLGDPAWTMPMTPWKFWRYSLPYLFGKGLIEMSYALRAFSPGKKDLWLALPYYGAVAFALTYFGGWQTFGLYWLLPYFTLTPFLHRFRYSTEHLALPRTHVLNNTRNVCCSAIENFLFSPHNGSMHMIHHNFPYIPWYSLKKARLHLQQNQEFRTFAHENNAYIWPTGNHAYGELTARPGNKEIEKKVA